MGYAPPGWFPGGASKLMMPNEDDSGMDDSLYSDTPSTDKPEDKPESVDEESAENPTALLPLSALGGKVRAGDTVTVKIVKIHGDEAEVEISASGDAENQAESESPDEEPDTDEMMKA